MPKFKHITMPTLPSIMNEFNASETSTLDSIDDFDTDITEAELEAILADDNKFINDTILEEKEIDKSLPTEEITQCLLKVTERKMRRIISTNHIIKEEAIMTQNSNKGDSKCKFFSILASSSDPEIYKYTNIAKDCNGHDTFYFHEYFA